MEPSTILSRETVKCEVDFAEPMDTSEAPVESYYEEGEINSSDDEKDYSGQIQPKVFSIFAKDPNKDKSREFVTGFNAFDKNEEEKKLNRAKRFSLPVKTVNVEVDEEQLTKLYRDLGIDKENERHYRFNAIHMRGTEDMSTEDVLQYFISYVPSHVEWINDVSCNVVWMDDISAARALLNMSKRIKNLDKVHLNADPFEKDFKETESENENVTDSDAVDARTISVGIPPGFWRIGVPSEKSSFILLRYATRSDKKQRNAEKNSDYYKKYGNPNFGNIPGILSKSLRSELKKSKYKSTNSDETWSMETNEAPSSEKKNPWEELAYEWGKTDKVEEPDYNYIRSGVPRRREPPAFTPDLPDLRISLMNKKGNAKRSRVKFPESSSNLSDDEAWESRNKVPRMKMYADDEEKRLSRTSERRQQSGKFKRKPVEDLRSKINRKKEQPRLKFREEKKREHTDSPSSENSNSENDYDEEDSGDWGLEHYHDIVKSVKSDRKHESHRHGVNDLESGKDEDEDDDDDESYKVNLGRISPLQIEINNDEYNQNFNVVL